jgi:hypothetical protein
VLCASPVESITQSEMHDQTLSRLMATIRPSHASRAFHTAPIPPAPIGVPRLIRNDQISARIKELQTAVAEHVVDLAVRKRSWRLGVLQNLIDRTLATIEARSVMYANQMGESQRKQVRDRTAEKAAINLGFFEVDDIGDPVAKRGKTCRLFGKTLL